MRLGLMPSARKGEYFELALRAIREIKKAQFAIKADTERSQELSLVPVLRRSQKLKPHLINQIDQEPDQRLCRVSAFGFEHAPDIAIDSNGTAIELKLIRSGSELRACLGQALIYRFDYRFAIMVLVDWTEDRVIVKSLLKKDSKEAKMLWEMCELNIFTVIGPVGPNKNNLAFVPKMKKGVPTPPMTPLATEGPSSLSLQGA